MRFHKTSKHIARKDMHNFIDYEYPAVLFIYMESVILRDGLVVRVPGYRTEMYCVSCEVRTEFIVYVM
jgi:hypothetical protein